MVGPGAPACPSGPLESCAQHQTLQRLGLQELPGRSYSKRLILVNCPQQTQGNDTVWALASGQALLCCWSPAKCSPCRWCHDTSMCQAFKGPGASLGLWALHLDTPAPESWPHQNPSQSSRQVTGFPEPEDAKVPDVTPWVEKG